MTNHLAAIANRHKSSRLRDATFALFVALAAVISVASVSTAADAASTHVASR